MLHFYNTVNCVSRSASSGKEGENYFHVTDPTGRCPDYDLAYTENMMLFPEQVRALIAKMTKGGTVYAPFLDYNEKDVENK